MLTMTPPRTVEVTPHTFIGVSLALLGVVLTLDNLGFVDGQEVLRFVLRFWPVVPILVGAVYVVQGRETRDWLVGAGWIAVGTAFLLRNLDVFRFRLRDFLPLILVAIGVRVMFGRRATRRWRGMPDPAQPLPPLGVPAAFGSMGEPHVPPPFGQGARPSDAAGSCWQGAGPSWNAAGTSWSGAPTHVLRAYSVLSGTERRHNGALAHVEVSAVLGGCDIDLRDAVPTSDPLVMQVFAMWGGIDVKVPPGWVIQNEAWPILGGIVDSTTPPSVPTHRVILRGNAFMGGVEVKN
jgi:hypothetical protein